MKAVLMVAFFTVMAVDVSAQVRVNVFPKATDGFVDSPRLQDTVTDLRDIISKRKGIVLAATDADADVTIEVLNSAPVAVGTESDTRVRRGIFGGVYADTTTETKTLPNITVMLRVRGSDYSKTMFVTKQRFWKDLAKDIVDQLETWIRTNQSQLAK